MNEALNQMLFKMKCWLLPICILIIGANIHAQTYRYVNTVFPSSTKTADVVYGTADFLNAPYFNESNTSVGDLVMDIYTPTGDANTNRPAIIFAHSGGFINGNRNHDDMVAFCDTFARKGYVTATIDYRVGFYVLTNIGMHSTRAAYRGLQDGRSAVRYLRANAALYGIDPDKIYFAGSSAGGFIALHSIYMDDPSEKPSDANAVSYANLIFPFGYSGPDLGPYDIGDHLSENGSPDAILSLWGAVENTSLITNSSPQPAFLVHGTSDGTVPFGAGYPFGYPLIPQVEGSDLINNQLNALGSTTHETYFISGADHEFYGTSNGTWSNGSNGNAHWDIIVDKTENFFWLRHKPDANFSVSTNNLEANFTFTGSDAISWLWNFGDGFISSQPNPSHTYASSDTYEVLLYIENNNLSWDTISMPVKVEQALPLSWSQALKAQYTKGETLLSWSVTAQINNETFVIEHSKNGRDFEVIGQVAGDNNLLAEKSFSFIHSNSTEGLHYYRIRQVDFDGQFSFSNVATVDIPSIGIQFFPNPAKDQITIILPEQQATQVFLYNALGQLIRQIDIKHSPFQLDVSDLATGSYFLQPTTTNSYQLLWIH